MQARTEDLALLMKLQQADLDGLHARKKLESLPQRLTIATLRKKKDTVKEKRAQVEKLLTDVEHDIAAIEEEDKRLAERQSTLQAEIDEVRSDYRSVETRTKELNGIAKRRTTLEERLSIAGEKLEKTETVRNQIVAAYDTLVREEAEVVASYRKEAEILHKDITRATATHASIAKDLPHNLVELYDKTAARCGGVAVETLSQAQCTTCRTELSPDRVIELRKNAPLGICPVCQRLLIVTGE